MFFWDTLYYLSDYFQLMVFGYKVTKVPFVLSQCRNQCTDRFWQFDFTVQFQILSKFNPMLTLIL